MSDRVVDLDMSVVLRIRLEVPADTPADRVRELAVTHTRCLLHEFLVTQVGVIATKER